jgi:hypothetical protein
VAIAVTLRDLVWILTAGLAVAWSAAPAHELSPYPTKPIKVIVGAAPGSPPDVLARLLAEQLAAALEIKSSPCRPHHRRAPWKILLREQRQHPAG